MIQAPAHTTSSRAVNVAVSVVTVTAPGLAAQRPHRLAQAQLRTGGASERQLRRDRRFRSNEPGFRLEVRLGVGGRVEHRELIAQLPVGQIAVRDSVQSGDGAGLLQKAVIATTDHEPADLLEHACSGGGLELTPQLV